MLFAQEMKSLLNMDVFEPSKQSGDIIEKNAGSLKGLLNIWQIALLSSH